MAKNIKLEVQGIEIGIKNINNEDYISLTDMLKAKDGDFSYLIGFEIEIH